MGRVDHDGSPVETMAFRGAISDMVRPVVAGAEEVENEYAEFRPLTFENRSPGEYRLTDLLGRPRPAYVAGDLSAEGRTDIDFGESCTQ